MQIFWTILSGVTVYVFGQIVLMFVVQPVHRQKETRGKIIEFLLLYARTFLSPGLPPIQYHSEENDLKIAKQKEASVLAKELASELTVRSSAIPFYSILNILGICPNLSDVRSARDSLFALSSGIHKYGNSSDNYALYLRIRELLEIDEAFAVADQNESISKKSE